MELFIYTDRPANAVKPGDLVDHPKGPMVVDETRSNIIGVDIYGRTPGVDAGPRRRLHLTFDETARVLPTSGDLYLIWTMILYVVDFHHTSSVRVSDSPELGHLAGSMDPNEVRTPRLWLGDNAPGQVIVQLTDDGEVWYVEPQYPVPAPEKPDDEASADF
jgi:hypothetical protein